MNMNKGNDTAFEVYEIKSEKENEKNISVTVDVGEKKVEILLNFKVFSKEDYVVKWFD